MPPCHGWEFNATQPRWEFSATPPGGVLSRSELTRPKDVSPIGLADLVRAECQGGDVGAAEGAELDFESVWVGVAGDDLADVVLSQGVIGEIDGEEDWGGLASAGIPASCGAVD